MARKVGKQQSQSESKKIAQRRRQLAEPEKAFLYARCDPDVESEIGRHRIALARHINFRHVPAGHPLRQLWTSSTSQSRFEVQHLADDLLTVENVEGFPKLLKRIVKDPEAYDDYRYELRMAANLARAGQRVTRLAGDEPGADVEFMAKSGHHCGLACYRARNTTPALVAASTECLAVAHKFLATFATTPVNGDFGIEVLYPRFPIVAQDARHAELLLDRMWRSPTEPAHVHTSGVEVKRCVFLLPSSNPDIRRRARLRFMFLVPERERSRIERHLRSKLTKENQSWASRFGGYPILTVEQSGFASGLSKAELAEILLSSETAFSGLISTQMMHPSYEGIVHGLEDVHQHLSPPDLHMELCTFGQNTRSWADDHPTVQYLPFHASEFWDLWEDSGGVHARCARPLGLQKALRRLDDRLASFAELRERPDVIQRLAQASIDLRDEAVAAFNW